MANERSSFTPCTAEPRYAFDARVSRAEVIDVRLDPGAPQLLDGKLRLLKIDLIVFDEFDGNGEVAIPAGKFRENPEKRLAIEITGEHVEIDLQRQIVWETSAEFLVGLVGDHLRERQRVARTLDDVDEAIWSDDRAVYIAPPGKHLASGHLPGL